MPHVKVLPTAVMILLLCLIIVVTILLLCLIIVVRYDYYV